MIFNATLDQTDDGDYLARCDDPAVSARGLSPENALDQLRAEIRYWVEYCPCSGVSDDYVELDLGSS